MHYYQFNIGDYASHTRHLSLYEDIAYRRLLDWYYLNEKPIPKSPQDAARLIGMKDRYPDVECVLEEFFLITEDGWVNKRADKEISVYKGFSDAGKRGAAKRWAKATDSPPITPPIATINQEPLTSNSNPNGLLVISDAVDCPHQEILKIYSEILPELPQPRIWEGQRKRNLSSRWKWVASDLKRKKMPYGKEECLDFFRRMFEYVSKSDLLMGRVGSWSTDLGWMVKADNFAKIIQGNYENKAKA